ncbi:uncharacterized protein [Argopecten irradians]|uniref:uncharacterized protein n=1 Tax=Argopecten irradians TaxID=31199 RepID=UPI003718CCDF
MVNFTNKPKVWRWAPRQPYFSQPLHGTIRGIGSEDLPGQPKIQLYCGRYVDDILHIIHSNVVDDFTDHLNNCHPAIKLTIERMKDNSIPVQVTYIRLRDDGSLVFSVYLKLTNNDQYLQFDSHQLVVVRTLTHRAISIRSTHQAKTQEEDHLKKVLSVSGYSKWAWDLPGSRNKTTERSHQRQPAKGHITIPYIGGISEHH